MWKRLTSRFASEVKRKNIGNGSDGSSSSSGMHECIVLFLDYDLYTRMTWILASPRGDRRCTHRVIDVSVVSTSERHRDSRLAEELIDRRKVDTPSTTSLKIHAAFLLLALQYLISRRGEANALVVSAEALRFLVFSPSDRSLFLSLLLACSTSRVPYFIVRIKRATSSTKRSGHYYGY